MELVKKNVHMLCRKSEAMNQITFDEDYNVPDIKPDVGRMIQKKGEVCIDEVLVSEGQANIKGNLKFHLLYAAEGDGKRIHSLSGEVPIDERLHLQLVDSGDKICLKWEVEDLSIQIINSRKLNIKSLITFQAAVDQLMQIQIPEECKEDAPVSVKKKTVNIMGLGVHKKDTMRLRKEITLASNKPNIHEILWNNIEVRGMDIRCDTDELMIKGELFVFVLYGGDDDSNPLQWMEQAVPFQQNVKCSGCVPELIPNIDTMLQQTMLDVKPDLDGEERILQIEAVIDLEIKLYHEKEYQLLQDVYSPGIQYLPERKDEVLERLLVKNDSKCKIAERVSLRETEGKLLQICHCNGVIKLDDIKVVKNGIQAEGVLQVRILYIVGDDDMPFYSMETILPFTHLIEARDIDESCRYYLRTDLEQLSTTMADSNAIEIKAVLNLNIIVLKQQKESLLVRVTEKPMDPSVISHMPGIVCYHVQEEDSLWDIARNFYTTIEEIKMLNQIETEETALPETLLLMKRVEE